MPNIFENGPMLAQIAANGRPLPATVPSCEVPNRAAL